MSLQGGFTGHRLMLFNGLFIDLSKYTIRIQKQKREIFFSHFNVCIETCLFTFCDFIKLAIDGHMCDNNLYVCFIILLWMVTYLFRLVSNNNRSDCLI